MRKKIMNQNNKIWLNKTLVAKVKVINNSRIKKDKGVYKAMPNRSYKIAGNRVK